MQYSTVQYSTVQYIRYLFLPAQIESQYNILYASRTVGRVLSSGFVLLMLELRRELPAANSTRNTDRVQCFRPVL